MSKSNTHEEVSSLMAKLRQYTTYNDQAFPLDITKIQGGGSGGVRINLDSFGENPDMEINTKEFGLQLD